MTSNRHSPVSSCCQACDTRTIILFSPTKLWPVASGSWYLPINTMLDIRISKIVVDATSHSPSVVSLTCRPITCVTAHISLHRGDGYCKLNSLIAAQKAEKANNQKGLGRFSQLNPLIAAQKAENANNQKGLGRFSHLAQLVELRFQPACSTCRA